MQDTIFKSCLEKGKFPLEWKKAKVVPAHEKGDKQIPKNYCPIFLHLITRKIFERMLYNNMFEFFLQKIVKYLTTNQDLNRLIHVLTDFSQLPMKHINHLTILLMILVYF